MAAILQAFLNAFYQVNIISIKTSLKFVFWWTSVQKMAWCMTTVSHEMIMDEFLWHSPEGNFTESAPAMKLEMNVKTTQLKLQQHPS